jgi:predicted HTH transcriptional regulator
MSFVKHIFNKDTLDKVELEDTQELIGSRTEESLHLDYEEIPKDVQYDGLADHISGFLNTSGGIVLFGVSESEEKGRHIPYKITWTTITKETLENNLYRKIDPWYEEIRILSLQNPGDKTQRIFAVYVPKSKNPPHMSNYRYFIRLNFQTQPIGHDQVLSIFKQYYLQKYDLVNTVYGPIYNELVSYYN